jgi:hypothetical protein
MGSSSADLKLTFHLDHSAGADQGLICRTCGCGATISMYGLSKLKSNQLATSSRNTEGANGRKLSRYLTLRLRVSCIVGLRGSPKIERLPGARDPNSIRPWNRDGEKTH